VKFSIESESGGFSETKIKVIEAGEKLFGEMGIEKAPLRSIASAAGQKNINAVQYHFKDRWGLLNAIFEYREAQLDIHRRDLLERGRANGDIKDLRYLFKVILEPNFRHYKFNNGISYIKVHADYLANIRQRGILHPVDYDTPSTVAFRQGVALLREKLSFLDTKIFNMRLEAIGLMFLNSVSRHHSTSLDRRPSDWALFHHLTEMAIAAFVVQPWSFDVPAAEGLP